MITYEHERNIYLMAKACNEKEKSKLEDAYRTIQKEVNEGGLDNKYGLIGIEEAILSANTYYNISKAIGNIEDKIIIDCGCHTALHQVFFKHAKKYIGIDLFDNFFKICDNAEFIQGNICDILPTLNINSDTIGISVLCGMCFKDVNASMKKYFNELIIL